MTGVLEKKRELKPEQSAAAHTIDRHVSVTAGPGSGKTMVLVERYLHILRENPQLQIDQIVAITFTHRAANEMRERLRQNLDQILSTCTADERQRWMRYKRTLDGAVINTIHGFCARLLREFPVEGRIDPQFTSLDAHDAAILLEAAVEETLTEFISTQRELTSQLVLGFGRSKLALALAQLYTDIRGQGLALPDLIDTTEASHASWEEYSAALEKLDRTMADFFALPRLTPVAEGKRTQARIQWPTVRQLLAAENPSLAEYCGAIEHYRSEARPTRIGNCTAIVDSLDELLWGKANDPGLVPQTCFDLYARDLAVEMLEILKHVELRYEGKKQQVNAVDFDDLQLRTLELLDNAAVLTRATQRYRFFLIDEFQDTNGIQRELTWKLALREGARANLFIVGDRKQSIYGFRGADVDVFQETTDELLKAGGTEKPLHLNFRSRPSLIDFSNLLFEQLFAAADTTSDELAELGHVKFEPSKAQREEGEPVPAVELLLDTESLEGDDFRAQRDAADRDARQIAQRILSLKQSGIHYGDIALLFRTMTNVRNYESVLRTANIPFQTVQGKGFYEREEVSDLIQLLRLLDNNTDELALAAVLRSPLGGISDNALLALRCAPWLRDQSDERALRFFSNPRRLFYALRHHQEIAYITEAEHEQLERVLDLLRKLIERRNHYPLADLLRFAVERSEYLTVIAANSDGAQRLANVHKLFALAERFERAGTHLIRDLVRYVEAFETIGSREAEGQIDESADAVRLMSIHQAKGLEFPVVIIPGLHQRPGRTQEHWYMLDRHQGLTVKVPDGRNKPVAGLTLQRFRDRAKKRESFESARVLYVAATRAREQLILSGACDGLNTLNGTPDNWLKLIWQKLGLAVSESGPVILEDGARGAATLEVTLNLANQPLTTDIAELEPPPLAIEADSLASSFPLLAPISHSIERSLHRFSVTQLINYQRCPRQHYFERVLRLPGQDEMAMWNNAEAPEPPANLNATLKGAVIHRFCEIFREGASPEGVLEQSFADVIRSRRAQLADRLPDINGAEALQELWPLAENYLASDVFLRVKAAEKFEERLLPSERPGLWSELSFRLRRPLGILHGTIDKLLIAPSEKQAASVEIIDFKTNRFPAQKAEAELSTSELAAAAPINRRTRSRTTDVQQIAFDFSPAVAQERSVVLPASSLADLIARTAADYQLQMQAYALAVRELLPKLSGDAEIRVTLHFLQPNVEFQLDSELLQAEICRENIDDAMRSIISSSEPEDFPVRPAEHCRMCSFLQVCEAGKRELASFRRRSRAA